MNTIPNLKGQRGFALIQMAMAVVLLAFIATQLAPVAAQARFLVYQKATVAGYNELMQATKSYYMNHVHDVQWPVAPSSLVSDGLLIGFQNRNGYGNPYSFVVDGATLRIQSAAANHAEALAVAAHFGGLASVTDDVVTVSMVPPGTDGNHNALVARDGVRDIYGTLVFRAGSGANIQMNSNNIESLGRLDSTGSLNVRNGSATGLINADVGAIDVLSVNEIRITP
ncbi:MAG: hypothetical protein Q8K97_17790 [Pseudohongiella sp.]|nr:hypothetical protein [Pseudohongiella sp.]